MTCRAVTGITARDAMQYAAVRMAPTVTLLTGLVNVQPGLLGRTVNKDARVCLVISKNENTTK